ncbi:hypothetical protein GTP23_18195 [Pseudoduganella sp. FT93W]|uniref:AbrB/MazE/SpoVT family DNA-binding domain-containing protein n=1 Tax=Duganella fentianensis TaxID=2692177 RepID=A0A845I3U2_9BURK|nr:hypothetical protein [Duganella fentianensis]MYN46977.1 hypothetical protein [Duganella fentianensis]
METQVTLELRQIGKHLALCLPRELALIHQLTAGQSLTVTIPSLQANTAAPVSSVGTLEQMLALFDPDKFGGEFHPSSSIGSEIIK